MKLTTEVGTDLNNFFENILDHSENCKQCDKTH